MDTARWVLPVLAPIVVVVIAHAVVSPGELDGVLRSVAVSAAWGSALVVGLVATILLVLAVVAVRDRERARRLAASTRTWTGVAVVGYLVMLTAVAGRMLPLPVFDALERHWQGKVIDLTWVAILFGMLHRWARAETGLRWRIEPRSVRPTVLVIGGVFGLFLALTVASVALDPATATPVSIEQLAFNATIPNLTEELIWRGAMLAVLNHLFGTPRRVLGAPVGWGIVITSIVFGLGHGVLVDLAGAWSLNVAGGLFAAVMALTFGWIWSYTGSIWPAFLLHCAPELGVDVGMLLAS